MTATYAPHDWSHGPDPSAQALMWAFYANAWAYTGATAFSPWMWWV